MSGNIVELSAFRESQDDRAMFQHIADQLAMTTRAHLSIAETRTAPQLRHDLGTIVELRRGADESMAAALVHLAGVWTRELAAREKGKPVAPKADDSTIPF
jgi:hypothetical protein